MTPDPKERPTPEQIAEELLLKAGDAHAVIFNEPSRLSPSTRALLKEYMALAIQADRASSTPDPKERITALKTEELFRSIVLVLTGYWPENNLVTSEVNIKGAKRMFDKALASSPAQASRSIPCPDGIEGCAVLHYAPSAAQAPAAPASVNEELVKALEDCRRLAEEMNVPMFDSNHPVRKLLNITWEALAKAGVRP